MTGQRRSPAARRRAGIETLARLHGVATSYVDARERTHRVPLETVQAVLGALDVNAYSEDAVAAALVEADLGAWRKLLPATVVLDSPSPAHVSLHAPEGARVHVRLEQADGGSRPLVPGPVECTRELGRRTTTRRSVTLPADLPLGYHELVATSQDGRERQERAVVVVAPSRRPTVPGSGAVWGWMLQLYALRSQASWGVGDLGDLSLLAARSARELGAAFVLCNPLHATALVQPIEPSPYYPSSRRFANPLYLRVEDLPEFAAANPAVRARVSRLAAEARSRNHRDRIDRDASWRAKSEALELLRGVPAERERRVAFAAFRERGGKALEDFATFCALTERHGRPWQRWPDKLRHPRHPAVAAARGELADRVAFHAWLQFCMAEQLDAVQAAAREAGMPIGIVHDLAVGVDPAGADAWALQDDLALGVTVGAPPDAFNRQGQDWRQPPLRPDRLVETGYAPFRDMLSASLARGGGVRVDHVLGLFRLWWIPEGQSPGDGTYVTYPARELLAVLALEAGKAGSVVVGEDLGTVAAHVHEALAGAGVLSSRLVYFERDVPALDPGQQKLWDGEEPGSRRRAAAYPRDALASVTTHDLPTVAGWWTDEEVRVKADLGLLGDGTTLEAERERKRRERAEILALLQAEGLVDGEISSAAEFADAVHDFLARTSSRLVAVQPGDAVGDLRQPNLPGTIDEYPNWRLPVAEPTAAGPRPILLEEFLERPRVRELAERMARGRAAR
jgi:4-alpha-glucanotransferase